MTLWIFTVVVYGDVLTPLVAQQPDNPADYEYIKVRLNRVQFGRITPTQFEAGPWPYSPTSAIDVVGNDFIRLTTGTASIYTAERMPVHPLWMETARTRRARFALLPPGVFPVDNEANEAPPDLTPSWQIDMMMQLCAQRRLLGGTAKVRFDMPISRPAGGPLQYMAHSTRTSRLTGEPL